LRQAIHPLLNTSLNEQPKDLGNARAGRTINLISDQRALEAAGHTAVNLCRLAPFPPAKNFKSKGTEMRAFSMARLVRVPWRCRVPGQDPSQGFEALSLRRPRKGNTMRFSLLWWFTYFLLVSTLSRCYTKYSFFLDQSTGLGGKEVNVYASSGLHHSLQLLGERIKIK